MLSKINAALLNLAQKWSEKTQNLTGKNCFWLARICIVISTFPTVTLWWFDSDNSPALNIILTLFSIMNSILSLAMVHVVEVNTSPKHINPLQDEWRDIQSTAAILMGSFTLTQVLEILITPTDDALLALIRYSCLLAAIYFCSCNPLPPGTSKFKKALKNFLARLTFVPDPTPART